MRITEVIALQCEIIETQSKIIDELYAQLSMHLAPEELGTLPLTKMKHVANERKRMEDT